MMILCTVAAVTLVAYVMHVWLTTNDY
jgi:hypothetical protein